MPIHNSTQPATAISSIKPAATPISDNAGQFADFKFQLTNRLQSSLDLYDVLNHFFQMIQSAVPISGIEYRYPKKNIHMAMGSTRVHHAVYTLKMTRHFLGELTFFRTKRFAENELIDIESLLGLLVMPLRNALMYRDALEHSLQDRLTGIGNRAALENALKREFKLARRANEPLSLLIADLDLFKRVNDTAGHSTGDLLLKKAASAIQATLRQTDQVFRYGGEEFVAILGGTQNKDALLIGERIRCAIAAINLPSKGGPVRPTISVGVSTLRESDSKEELVERADEALYRAKAAGRNQVISAESTTAMSIVSTAEEIDESADDTEMGRTD
jgi:diguanylate cyclase (GGDEF)-like protein